MKTNNSDKQTIEDFVELLNTMRVETGLWINNTIIGNNKKPLAKITYDAKLEVYTFEMIDK